MFYALPPSFYFWTINHIRFTVIEITKITEKKNLNILHMEEWD